MPNRILREGILTSPRMARLGWAEEVFYRRLMSVVDDFGRYFADPGLLRAACYPRQLNKVSDPDIGKWLRACVDAALVRVYPAEDGESYLEIADFKQQVRAKESKFPRPPPDAGDLRSTCVADAEHVQANAHLDVSVVEDVSVGESATANAASKPRPAKKAPASFLIDADLQKWARDAVPNVDIRAETDKFRDHTFARGITDWPGTWRNWMRRAAEGPARVNGSTAAPKSANPILSADEPL